MAIFMAVTYYNYCHSKAYAPGNTCLYVYVLESHTHTHTLSHMYTEEMITMGGDLSVTSVQSILLK